MRTWCLPVALLVGGIIVSLGISGDLDFETRLALRLPRLVAALAVGLGLAISGAALQSLFANPLAEPYTLGISSGATLGAVTGIMLGVERWILGVPAAAFVGALAFGLILLLVSYRRGVGNLVLLLTGVMMGLFGSSLVALWMALADPHGVWSAVYWLMGDLSRARLEAALPALFLNIAVAGVIWRHWKSLDALLTGEESAKSLGIPVTSVRRTLLLAVSLMVGVSVSLAGMIGFVGLLVPHLVRLISGALHRNLIPMCGIWGAAIVVIADIAARGVAAPLELPVGVVTALIGAPAFLWMLHLGRRTP